MMNVWTKNIGGASSKIDTFEMGTDEKKGKKKDHAALLWAYVQSD